MKDGEKGLHGKDTGRENSPERARIRPGVIIIMGAAITVITLRFLWVCYHYPYHFLWDMDLFGPIGSMTVQRQEIPRVLGHPAFGMYLLHAISHRIAYGLGIVSVLGSDQLGSSLSPTLSVVELTSYLRLHSPIIVVTCVLALWAAIVRLLKPSILWSLVLLAALACLESLVLNAAMIRVELFAILYWSIAILLMAFAARSVRPWRQVTGIGAAGVMLGLCFLTKVQGLLYIGAAPLILLLMLSLCPVAWKDLGAAVSRRFVLAVSLLTFVGEALLCALLVIAGKTAIPSDFQLWDDGFWVQNYTALLVVAVAALFAGQLYMATRREVPAAAFRVSSFATFLFLGFLGSFFLHFLLYDDLSTGFRYLLYDVKIAFLRNSVDSLHKGVKGIAALHAFRSYNPGLFYVHVLALVALIAGTAFNRLSVPKRALLPVILVSAVTIGNQVLAVRAAVPRDLIWVEVLPCFLSLVYLSLVYRHAVRWPGITKCLAVAGLVVLLASNYMHSSTMLDRTDWRFHQYGWRDGWWFTDLGGYNAYPKVILPLEDRHLVSDVRFCDRANLGQLARQHREVRRTANFVVHNQDVTFRSIGLLARSYPVWTDDLDWRVTALPEHLRKALVVDCQGLPIARPRTTQSLNSSFWKINWPDDQNNLCLIGRPDLEVYLFLRRLDADRLIEIGAVQVDAIDDAPMITLRKNGQSQKLCGINVRSAADIPIKEILHPYFVVIGRNPLSTLAQ